MANLGVSAPDCKRGVFSTWQQVYAEHGIATFPVTANKAPATKGYLRTGLNGSKQLAQKFLDADAFGFACGRSSKITVVDIDTTNENVVADAIARHGEPPIITRTASGKFHLPYRYNGERRQIRPFPDIDVLGDGGMVIAAPSKISTGTYEFIKGNLDELDRLKPMRGIVTPVQSRIQKGHRKQALFEHCRAHVHACDTMEDLLDVGMTYRDIMLDPHPTPISDARVLTTVRCVRFGIITKPWAREAQSSCRAPS
jgi:hypothetical protein